MPPAYNAIVAREVASGTRQPSVEPLVYTRPLNETTWAFRSLWPGFFYLYYVKLLFRCLDLR